MVFAQDIGISDHGGVLGTGIGTIGDKARLPLRGGSNGSDPVGDHLAKALSILRNKGDHIPLLQGGRIHGLGDDQISRIEMNFIRCIHGGQAHGVSQDDIGAISEDIPVCPIKGGNGNHREDQHKCGNCHQERHQNGLYNIKNLFHWGTPLNQYRPV